MKRLKLLRISKYAIIICLLLSIIFAGFTVYGANTGNFNVYVQESDVNLAVYMTDDKSDMSAHLTVPTLDEMFDCTYAFLPTDISTQGSEERGLGSKNDRDNHYLAFSVMLVNLSERGVDYGMALTVTETRTGSGGGEVLNAMRVAVIEGDNPLNTAKIYAKPETSEENEAHLQSELDIVGHYPSETVDFKSDVQIFDEFYYDLAEDGEVKYTIVIWLEGCDKECVNDLFGSKIKMRLDFTGR